MNSSGSSERVESCVSNPYPFSTGEGEKEGEGGRGDTGGDGAWVWAAEWHLQWEEVREGYLPDSL